MMCLRAQRKIGRERNFSKRAEEELEREKDLRRIAEAEAQGLREALHGQPGASGSRAPERSDAAHSVSNASMSWRSSPGPSAAALRRSEAASTRLTGGLTAGRSPRRSPSRRSRSPSSSAASWVGFEVRDAIGDRRAATSPSTSRLSRGHDLPDHPAMREPAYRGAVDHPQAFRG